MATSIRFLRARKAHRFTAAVLLCLTACEEPVTDGDEDFAEMETEDADFDSADDESSGGELDDSPDLGEFDDLATEDEPQQITGGWPVPNGSLYAYSTVSLGNCTGVIVADRYVLTAAHCTPVMGQIVRFYSGSLPSGPTRWVVSVSVKPGVNAAMGDYTDTSGKFADIAVLRLNADVPAPARPAELPLVYPGNSVWGTMVGRGNHEGAPNTQSELRYRFTKTYSSNTNDGHFLTDSSDLDPGDSGGPLYMYNSSTGRLEVQGVLFGTAWEWAWRGKYTSIRHHLSWVMDNIGYDVASWSSNRRNIGPTMEVTSTGSDKDICALACEKRASCAGVSHYAYYPYLNCTLHDSVTGSYYAAGYNAGVL